MCVLTQLLQLVFRRVELQERQRRALGRASVRCCAHPVRSRAAAAMPRAAHVSPERVPPARRRALQRGAACIGATATTRRTCPARRGRSRGSRARATSAAPHPGFPQRCEAVGPVRASVGRRRQFTPRESTRLQHKREYSQEKRQ